MTVDSPRTRLGKWVPWFWLAMSLVWAIVIIVTDQIAWPLALWIGTTLGPLTYLTARFDSDNSKMKGRQE